MKEWWGGEWNTGLNLEFKWTPPLLSLSIKKKKKVFQGFVSIQVKDHQMGVLRRSRPLCQPETPRVMTRSICWGRGWASADKKPPLLCEKEIKQLCADHWQCAKQTGEASHISFQTTESSDVCSGAWALAMRKRWRRWAACEPSLQLAGVYVLPLSCSHWEANSSESLNPVLIHCTPPSAQNQMIL